MPPGRKKPISAPIQPTFLQLPGEQQGGNGGNGGNIVEQNTNNINNTNNTNDSTGGAGAGASAGKIPKKQKKQFSVVATVGPTGIKGSLQQGADMKRPPLIAHLPIQSKDIVFHDQPIAYNPLPPNIVEPFDETMINPFCDEMEEIGINEKRTGGTKPDDGEEIREKIGGNKETGDLTDSLLSKSSPIQSQLQKDQPVSNYGKSPDFNRTKTLLVEYKDTVEIKQIPKSVNSACFWCCHTFTWQPVVLPYRDMGDYLQVCGNFCSPQCACAYLFSQKIDSHLRWEQLSLLHRIYGDIYHQIVPAPSRNVLQLFGGQMTIEEYRDLIFKGKQRIDIHMPPMISLLETMDTKPIDFYDTTLTKTVMETVQERLTKAEESLKLKRTKPLRAWESTLDAYINLKIKPGGTTGGTITGIN